MPAIADAERPPNFIVVFCDNLGYGDIEPFGSSLHRTPNLNRMAEEGRKFTHFNVTAGVCTPSRASLMTGCYAQRVGMHTNPRDGLVLRPVSPYGLNPDEETMAEVLKASGYATAIVGKWHLGDQPEFLPTRQGFDWFFGVPYSDDMTERIWKQDGSHWPPLPLMENETVVEAPCDRNGLTKRYTERAMEWIAAHKDEPFFLYFPQAMPGSTSTPFSSDAFRGKSKNGPWGDAIEELDWSMGVMLDQLRELGIAENTLVIWTSDNGAPINADLEDLSRGSNRPLHGAGYTTAEGAFRVPTIVWQPGTVPAGTVCTELATTMDLLPTFAKLSGGTLPARTIDGHDIVPLLHGVPGATSPYDAFFYYQEAQLHAVRSGPWKMFLPVDAGGRHPHFKKGETPQPLLFNVVEDIGSKHNLAGEHPDIVARLNTLAAHAREDLGDTDRTGSGQRAPGKVDGPKPMRLAASMSSEEFMKAAVAVLPEEASYDYHKYLATGPVHETGSVHEAEPVTGELALAGDQWKLRYAADAGAVVQFAASDLQDFLNVSMGLSIELERSTSLVDWAAQTQVIVAGTPDQLPGLGSELRGSKDYEILISPERIVVCGYDAQGILFGLMNLEERMRLRGAPCLPNDLHLVRHSLYQTRAVISWLGWMQWPDALLKQLVHDGYDAIYASVYANPNGAEGPPHYDIIRKQDGDKLRDLIRRATSFGIKVYCPILYANTGTPENEAGLREHVRDIVTKFPEIHGYILLTEGFYYKKFFGAGGHGDTDLKEWAQHWTRAVGIVADVCHAINPAIEILPWEYNIDFRPNRVALKRYVTSLMPEGTIPLLTWENGTAFELDGWKGYLRDYSISQVGPAAVAAGQIEEAKSRGMTVYCKVDCFATWQFGTFPYVPAPQQWQRRYDALAAYGVNGTLETWSNGYKPNFMADLRAWSCWTNPMPYESLLAATARRIFGPGNESHALAAWALFSEAIQYVPDTGPSMGTNSAVANPMFLENAPARMMTLNNSWWDEAQKSHWRHRLVPEWPFAHPIMVFYPDFTNKSNRAEQYARVRSGIGQLESAERLAGASIAEVFNKYVLRAADAFEAGLQHYRLAAVHAPPDRQAGAMKEVLVVEQMQRMLRSLQAIIEFEDVRFYLATHPEATDALEKMDRMEVLLNAEVARTTAALETSRLDSRLGYESEMDYVYTPFVLEQKLQVLKKTQTEQLPKLRESRRQTQ